MDRLLNRNRIFIDRTKGVGVLVARGSDQPQCHRPDRPGQRRDARSAQGRAVSVPIADFDFKVCCAKAGDCFARYLVRMAEMRESLRIVAQAIENLPAGAGERADRRADGAADEADGLFDDRGDDLAFRADDEQSRLRGAVRRIVRGDRSRRTASWAFIWSATAPDVAYRARCRPPSYIHFALFPYLIRGHTLSDIVAVLGSLNIIAAELDR